MGKTLIAYYSRRGENYVNGSIKNLKLGNCAHNNSTYEYSRRVSNTHFSMECHTKVRVRILTSKLNGH